MSKEKLVRSLRQYQFDSVEAANNAKDNTLIVLPTGAGKSHVIAGICVTNPGKRVLILSHVKEILEQNAEKLKLYLPSNKVGLYSSGLGLKQTFFYCVAGIQSAYNNIEHFRKYDIIIIDEAHRIPAQGEGMYLTFLALMPGKKVIGLTATPYRMVSGLLTNGPIFKSICYKASIPDLIDQGYLCRLINKVAEMQLDTSKVKKIAGDYSKKDLSVKFDTRTITSKICKELAENYLHRKSWLVFAIDIEHAEHITDELCRLGVDAIAIHSKMSEDRRPYLEEFKQGRRQVLVSIETLTTGFDAPNIDLIAILRPTLSPVLHEQMIGRGFRPWHDKDNCLILDFAGNLLRLGPVGGTINPSSKIDDEKGKGEAPTKVCPDCKEVVYAATKICPDCGYKFPEPKTKLSLKASDAPVVGNSIKNNLIRVEVTSITYCKYQKERGGTPSLKVMYRCGLRTFNQFIALEHKGYPRVKAEAWWKFRTDQPVPDTVDEAVLLARSLKRPSFITVYTADRFPEIVKVEF